jgi:large subunit ribosomal protein L10
MSKQIKQMEMEALKQTFSGARNLVFLTSTKVDAIQDYNIRKTLRGQKIRLTVVKNSLARRVLSDLGIKADDGIWAGPTTIAYGAESVKELSLAIDKLIKDTEKKDPKSKDRIKVKGAVAEGEAVSFERAKTMPTRQEAIGEIIGMILGPASTIAAMLTGPASQVASQISQLAEKKEGEPEKKEGESAPAATA